MIDQNIMELNVTALQLAKDGQGNIDITKAKEIAQFITTDHTKDSK